MSNALIIGCEGQDGRLLAKLLKEKKYSIVGSSRSITSKNTDIDEFITADLTGSSFSKLQEYIIQKCPAEIYYLSAHHKSSQESESFSNSEIENSVSVNYQSFLKLLESCRAFSPGTRISYTSSSLIYSGKPGRSQDESTLTSPNCLYSLNKVAAMQAASFYRKRYSAFVSVGIMYNHESIYRNDYFLSKRIVNQVRDFVAGKISKITIGSLDSVTDWGYALDYVEALWHTLQLPLSGDYIVSSGKGRTVNDWIKVLEGYLKIELSKHIVVDQGLLSRTKPTLIGDNSKILLTGWKPRNSFEDMVIKIYDNKI
jgi:GDPmannose 4,6-dehydratase